MSLFEVYPDIISEVPGTIPFEFGVEQRSLVTHFENGSEQRRLIDISPRRNVKLYYTAITQAQAQTLHTFYRGTYGTLESFYFVFPQEKTIVDELAGRCTYIGQSQLKVPSRYATYHGLKRNGVVTTNYTFYSYPYSGPTDLVSLNFAANIGDVFHWTFVGRLIIRARFAEGALTFSDIKNFTSSLTVDLVSVQNTLE